MLVLKNEQRELKLQALDLPTEKADTVVKGITVILNEFNLWKSIKMIIADTMNVNTGRRYGIVTQLPKTFFFKRTRKNQIHWLSTPCQNKKFQTSVIQDVIPEQY